MTNYLPMAAHFGVGMFCGIEAQLEPTADGRWRVIARRTGRQDQNDEVVVTARRVVVSAGALGTNAILMRSRQGGLKLSTRLGKTSAAMATTSAAHNTDIETMRRAGRRPTGHRAPNSYVGRA